MKKYIFLFIALMSVLVVKADEKSEKILQNLAAKLSGYGSYEVKFSVVVKGAGSMDGSYAVSGNKYHITVQQQTQFSDGVNRYEVYNADKEVVIDKADLKSRNILNNPTKAFDFLPSEFSSVWKGERQVGGVLSNVISLTPRDSKLGTGSLTVYVGAGSGLPVALDYNYHGEEITIKIEKITPLTSVDKSLFLFDVTKYKDYEVVDFR